MPNHTRLLRTLCVSLPLVLAVACRDEEPNPVPPLPPPELPQQPSPSPANGDSVAPDGTKSSGG